MNGPPADGFDDRRYHRAAAAVLMAMACGYVVVAASSTLWDRDEPRFARAAVEMVDSGDYLVPHFNGRLRPDKPAAVYWAMSLPLRLMSNKTLAVRLPSVAGLLAATWLTYLVGRRMFGGHVGLWAMAMLATALNVMVIGTAATADGLLLAWLMLATWCLVEMFYRRGRWWHYPVLAVALGGGMLTKGPVGLLPVLTAVGVAWAGRRGGVRLGQWGWAGLAGATAVAVGMFLVWAIPANQATAGQFARQGIGRHVIDRILHPAEGHGLADLPGYLALVVGFYPLALVVGFFPWTLMLPGAISAVVRGHLGGPRERAVLAGWAVPTFAVMSLVATKLPHYILPIYPALAIASAAVMQAQRRGELGDKDRDWLRGGIWFFLPVAVVLGGAALGAGVFLGGGQSLPAAVLVTVGIATMAVLAVRAQLAEQLGRSARLAVIGTVVSTLLAARLVFPLLERSVKVSPQVAQVIAAAAGPDVPVFTRGYDEPSLVFYLDRPANAPVQGLGEEPGRWVGRPGRAVLVTTERELAGSNLRLDALPAAVSLLGRFETINYAAGSRKMTVVVLGRNLTGPAGEAGASKAGGAGVR